MNAVQRYIFLFVLLASLLTGCDELNPIVVEPTWTVPAPRTPGPTAAPSATPELGPVLFEDHFDDVNSGWPTGPYDSADYEYVDGAYSITTSEKETMQWANIGQQYSDVVLSVKVWAVQIPGEGDNAFGLMCRLQENGNGYLFRISSDGYYAISVANDDGFTTLVGWSESSLIRLSDTPNEIQASCVGSHLEMYVNGTFVAEVFDKTYISGDIGLTATTYEDSPTEIHYDDFIARQPE